MRIDEHDHGCKIDGGKVRAVEGGRVEEGKDKRHKAEEG